VDRLDLDRLDLDPLCFACLDTALRKIGCNFFLDWLTGAIFEVIGCASDCVSDCVSDCAGDAAPMASPTALGVDNVGVSPNFSVFITIFSSEVPDKWGGL
jgi:hypothetical protein